MTIKKEKSTQHRYADSYAIHGYFIYILQCLCTVRIIIPTQTNDKTKRHIGIDFDRIYKEIPGCFN